MNSIVRYIVLGFVAAVAGGQAFAAENSPLMAKPGKLLFEDNFARPEMKPKWKVGKGFWSIEDDVVTAAENPDDHHGAYAYIDPNIDYKDVVVEYSFKLDSAKNLHLNMRDSKYKGSHAGHILRATIFPTMVQLVDMKTGGMKNEYYDITSNLKTTPEEKKAIQEKYKDKSANFKISLDLAAWHQARVEVVGEEILMSIDGKPVGLFKSEGIGHEAKNMIGFTVGGSSAHIKNVKVWEAAPSLDWTSRRDDVTASLKK